MSDRKDDAGMAAVVLCGFWFLAYGASQFVGEQHEIPLLLLSTGFAIGIILIGISDHE